MSEHKENVPKIRFPGFTDAWEDRKLSDLMFFSNGINAPKQSYGKGRKMISVMDILSKELLTYEQIKGSVKVNDKIEQKNKVEKGDLVFVRSSEIREEVGWAKAYLQEEYALYSGFSIRGKKKSSYDAYFIELSINHTNRNQIERKAGGSTRFNVSQEILNNIIIFEPTFDEQVKISEFFKGLDNNITLHQRKLNNVKNLKAGLLQKMFPKDGKDFPEIRFPGFTNAWEQRELGEVTEVYDGTHQTPDYKDEGVMFLSVEDIKTLQSDKYISEEAFENEFKVRPEKGDVLMTRIGDVGTANVVASNEPIAYYVSLALLKKKDLNPCFLQASIHSFAVQDEIWKRTLHIAFPKKINKNEIAKVPINFPSEQEQDKIGSFFSELDNLITLHQRKLEHLQEQKKALLQQMFI